jgi:hypothetical protein
MTSLERRYETATAAKTAMATGSGRVGSRRAM